jgi:hypothetical protein
MIPASSPAADSIILFPTAGSNSGWDRSRGRPSSDIGLRRHGCGSSSSLHFGFIGVAFVVSRWTGFGSFPALAATDDLAR